MTATTSNVSTQRRQAAIHFVWRMATAAGSIAAAIGSGWRAFVDAGQLGPDRERSISRHTGARI